MPESVNSTTSSAPELRFRHILRVCVWLGAGAFLFILALRDLQLDRRLDVVARLDRATPYLSTLGPPARVVLSADRVTVLGEPVYINLRIPRWFHRATVELRYENPSGVPLRFGVQTPLAQWAFDFPEPEPHPLSLAFPGGEKEPPAIPSGEGVATIRIPFNLQRSLQVERNVYRFVLSAPGVRADQPIVVHGLRVTAERDPICLGRLCV